jgi:hypothetical protein
MVLAGDRRSGANKRRRLKDSRHHYLNTHTKLLLATDSLLKVTEVLLECAGIQFVVTDGIPAVFEYFGLGIHAREFFYFENKRE